MARTRSGPLGGRPKTRWNACRYSAMAAMRATAASQARLAHLHWIDDRQRRLLLKRLDPAVPELRLVVEGIQNGRRVALADAAFDTDRNRPAVGESAGGIVTGAAGHGAVSGQAAIEEQFLAQGDLSGVWGLSGGIAARVASTGKPTCRGDLG